MRSASLLIRGFSGLYDKDLDYSSTFYNENVVFDANGSYGHGYWADDTISLGKVTLSNAKFGVVPWPNDSTNRLMTDGVMGLSPGSNQIPVPRTIFDGCFTGAEILSTG